MKSSYTHDFVLPSADFRDLVSCVICLRCCFDISGSNERKSFISIVLAQHKISGQLFCSINLSKSIRIKTRAMQQSREPLRDGARRITTLTPTEPRRLPLPAPHPHPTCHCIHPRPVDRWRLVIVGNFAEGMEASACHLRIAGHDLGLWAQPPMHALLVFFGEFGTLRVSSGGVKNTPYCKRSAGCTIAARWLGSNVIY
jgi:hypothetical protein